MLSLYIHVMLADPAIQLRLPLGRNKQISIYLSNATSCCKSPGRFFLGGLSQLTINLNRFGGLVTCPDCVHTVASF